MSNWAIRCLVKARLWVETEDDSSRVVRGRYVLYARTTVWELVAYIALIFAVLWAIQGLIWDMSGSTKYWFQRSGAALVAAGVTSEFFAFNKPDNQNGRDSFYDSSEFLRTIRRGYRVAGYTLAVVGTLIWAYGDLPFRQAC